MKLIKHAHWGEPRLSEPHPSVTAFTANACVYLCLLACLDRPLTESLGTRLRATVRVHCRGPGAKTNEVEVRMALLCAFADDGRPLIGGTNLVSTVGRFR